MKENKECLNVFFMKSMEGVLPVKNGMNFIVFVFVCAFMLMAGNSEASFYGSIWAPVTGYNSGTHDLTTAPAGTPNAMFTVDKIDFSTTSSPETYDQFLSNGSSNPNNLDWIYYNAPVTPDTTIITSGTYTSFIQLTGTAYFGANTQITHDDGFVLYLGSTKYDFSTPTSPQVASLGNTAGVYNFTLNYAAWNSFPEVLKAPGVNPVPIPAAIWIFGSGLLGLIGIRRRATI